MPPQFQFFPFLLTLSLKSTPLVAPPTGELSGQFWQTDQFDHLVRSEEQFRFLRDYIRLNPTRAGLKAGDCLHFSREM